MQRIRRNHRDAVEYVEIDLKFPPAYFADDPLFASEWRLEKTGASPAWDLARGDGVTVANLDSGVDCAHEDLARR